MSCLPPDFCYRRPLASSRHYTALFNKPSHSARPPGSVRERCITSTDCGAGSSRAAQLSEDLVDERDSCDDALFSNPVSLLNQRHGHQEERTSLLPSRTASSSPSPTT